MEAAHREDSGDPLGGPTGYAPGRINPSPSFFVGEQFDADHCSGIATVTVKGELDLAAKSAAEEALLRAQLLAEVVVLDLSGVSFIDSAGLHVIIDANTRQREAGRRLVVITGSPQVQRMLTLTGVVEQLEIGYRVTAAEATAEVRGAHWASA